MEIKILEGKEITKEIQDIVSEEIDLAGVDFKLNKELNIITNMYSSVALGKLEKLAKCEKGHIQNMMKDKLASAVQEIAIEISNIKSKAYVNAIQKMFDEEEKDETI